MEDEKKNDYSDWDLRFVFRAEAEQRRPEEAPPNDPSANQNACSVCSPGCCWTVGGGGEGEEWGVEEEGEDEEWKVEEGGEGGGVEEREEEEKMVKVEVVWM